MVAEEEILSKILDDIPETFPEEMRDVLFESKQGSLPKAVAADLLDTLPVVGDIGNFFRIRHASKVGRERPRRLTYQAVDLLAGVLPDPAGAIADLILPLNTITYLREEA